MKSGLAAAGWPMLGILALSATAEAAPKELPEVGKPAPNFQVTTFDGAKSNLADFKGQVIVLNFWATWCGPCRQELPLLDAFFRKLHEHGLQMFAVATEDSLSPFQLMPVQKVVSFPMVRKFKGDYGKIKALPTNVVIDRSGVVRYSQAGAFNLEEINLVLVPLLREPMPES